MTPKDIQDIRKKLCVTQEKFAQLLGTTVVSVNRWEMGKAKPSRLYIKELKELRNNYGSYVCRRKEFEES
jgi:putative transcriptional regulator